MGHIGQESAFGLAGPVGLQQSVFQKPFLLHFIAGFRIHAPKPQDHAVTCVPGPYAHGFQLGIFYLAVLNGPEIGVILLPVGQVLFQLARREGVPHHFPVFFIDVIVYVMTHVPAQRNLADKSVPQQRRALIVHLQQIPRIRVQVKKADNTVVCCESVYQFHLTAFALYPFGVLALLLGGAVQKEALVSQVPVLPYELDVAHDIEQLFAFVAEAVFHADAVAFFLQRQDSLSEPIFILVHHGGGDHVEAVIHQFFRGIISQDVQGGLVDADDSGSVQGMAHHAAFQSGENRLQGLVLLGDFLFIGTLLGHIDCHAHRAHDAAVQIVQGGFVGGKQLHAVAGLYQLFRHTGLAAVHDSPVGLHAVIVGGIVGVYIPDIVVIPSLHLLLGLAHGLAEAVVDFFVDAFFGLVPDQGGHMVDGGIQKMAGLPEILFCLAGLLPSQETERKLLL